MTQLSAFVEPALELDAYSTLEEALPSLGEGKPVWLPKADRWAGLTPSAAVGYSHRRRIVDFPLVELALLSVSARASEVLSRRTAGGYLPLVSDGHLFGQVQVSRVERSVGVIRSELATAIAHDLNNSLCAVSALIGEAVMTDAAEKALDHSLRLIRRLQGLAGRRVGPPSRLDLGALVTEQVAWLRPVAAPVTILTEIDPATPMVLGDQAGLERIVVNLVMNARDALDGRGGIRLVVRRSASGGSVLEVEDDGPGIPTALRDHVFAAGQTSKGVGRGIGLASAREAAAQMGGHLALIRTSGSGTVFRLELEPSDP